MFAKVASPSHGLMARPGLFQARKTRLTTREFQELAKIRRREEASVLKPFPHQAVVQRMTNWQRTQWAKAGYPKDQVEHFANLQYPV